jgi:type I restriction enzyme M protein
MAFVQHMVASLAEGGRMAVVLPNGALFRARTEAAVRRDLVEADIVEAVIQLPKDMFYGAGIPACYLVINCAKSETRRGRILFVDGSQGFHRTDTKNVLRDEDIDRIVEAYRGDQDREGFSAWVSNQQVAERRFNLTVRRYVSAPGADDETLLTVAEALAEFRVARIEREAAEADLDEVLTKLDGNGSA